MKVVADWDLCEANAVCARLAPQVFSVYTDDDDEDVLAIAADGEVPPEQEAGVRAAVDRCPKMALTLNE
jgi:ferredoxin